VLNSTAAPRDPETPYSACLQVTRGLVVYMQS
jgi:hypothetical protein